MPYISLEVTHIAEWLFLLPSKGVKILTVWKDIAGYEGHYQVSDAGQVRSLDRFDTIGRELPGRILKTFLDGSGYPSLNLFKDGFHKKHKVHRLVAQSFIPNPFDKPEVNHIDENKLNNSVSNLEWMTRKENENHGTKRARCKENTDYAAIADKNSKPVLQYDLSGRLIKEWPSIIEIQKTLGYSKGNISSCCNGKIKCVYKSVWKFKQAV